jgi:uncharacterized protein (DUF58 family)
LLILALVTGFYTGRDLFFYLVYALAFILIVSFFWSLISLRTVSLNRVTRVRRTQVGRPLEERFRVRNSSFIPKLWLEVRDFSDLPGHQASYVVNFLGARGEDSWRVNTMCQQRGRYQLGPMRLRTSDPFGLFPMTQELPQTTHVVVLPLTVDLPQFALPTGILPGGDALRRRTQQMTTNASGVREYTAGDSFSRIHWPSSARRDRLIVKEFELDPLADIWLVPDMARFGHYAKQAVSAEGVSLNEMDIPAWMQKAQVGLWPTTEEYTVTLTASLAQLFLRADRAVGMLAYGQVNEVLQPDRGERQLNRILETLAVLRAQGEVALTQVVQREAHLFARGTTLIVVTPTVEVAWAGVVRGLRQRGLRVVSVLVNPASFGGRGDVAALSGLLQGYGSGVYVVNEGDDFTAVLAPPTTYRRLPR